jgi:hypothetical protein
MGASAGSVELQVKAAYLFNFARYVEWPQQTGVVIIGVVGHDPIVDALEKIVAGKTVKGRPYRVKVIGPHETLDRCAVVYVPRAESRHVQRTMTAVAGKAILTVSDVESFSKYGGMVEFLLMDETLKFKINLGAAEKSGLRISSELLRVAYEIKGRRH